MRNLALVLFLSTFVCQTTFAQEPALDVYSVSQSSPPLHGDVAALKELLERDQTTRNEIKRRGIIELIVDKARVRSEGKAYLDPLREQVAKMLTELGLDGKRIRIEHLAIDWNKVRTEAGMRYEEALALGPEAVAALAESAQADRSKPIRERIIDGLVRSRAAMTQLPTRMTSMWGMLTRAGGRALRNPVRSFITTPACAVAGACRAFAREAVYIPNALYRAFERPPVLDLIQGGLAKGPATVAGTAQVISEYTANGASMVNAGVHVSMGIGLSTFFGPFLTTWMNFNAILEKERGYRYQTVMLFINGQVWPFLFALNAWSAGMADFPAFQYFAISIGASIPDSALGAAKFNSLNSLVNKGVIPRWVANGFQLWISDTVLTLQGNALGMGAYKSFAFFYGLNQLLNAAVVTADKVFKQRPKLVFVDPDMARTEAFQSGHTHLFPKTPEEPSEPANEVDGDSCAGGFKS